MPSSSRTRCTSATGTVAAPVTASRSEREVVPRPVGVVEERLEHRRRALQDGDAVAGDAGQRGAGVEDGLGQDRGADRGAREHAGLVAGQVGAGARHEVAVGRVEPGDVAPGCGRAGHRPVREQHALGRAGRARRELHVADVVGPDERGAPRERPRRWRGRRRRRRTRRVDTAAGLGRLGADVDDEAERRQTRHRGPVPVGPVRSSGCGPELGERRRAAEAGRATTTTRARERASSGTTSAAGERVDNGTRRAPAASAPKPATIQGAPLGAHTATAWPGSTPPATQAAANASIRSASSAQVQVVGPSTTAGRSGWRPAVAATHPRDRGAATVAVERQPGPPMPTGPPVPGLAGVAGAAPLDHPGAGPYNGRPRPPPAVSVSTCQEAPCTG